MSTVYSVPTTIKNQQLVEKRREQIVLAAINLFSKKGYHKSTLRELAEGAGISQGNIYDYIGNKEDIFYLLHEFMANLVEPALERAVEGIDDPLDKLRRMARSEFNVMSEWADTILLIYQESHILNDTLLKRLLANERRHISRFETVLEECIEQRKLQEFNTRVAANLIKSMIDTWVLKRWDLMGHVTQFEMERSILDLVFYGLLREKDRSNHVANKNVELLEGKTGLLINGGNVVGKAISSFLIGKGMRLAIQGRELKGDKLSTLPADHASSARLYPDEDYGPMTVDLFKRIMDDFGPIDMIVHDLGIGNVVIDTLGWDAPSAPQGLEVNLQCARDLCSSIEKRMTKKGWVRILYLAPWAWDMFPDQLQYSMVKAGAIALTKAMAKRMASSRTNVNCIVPGFVSANKLLRIDKEKTRELIKHIPLGYIGEIEDVLEGAYFLISDASKYLTGQVLELSGGTELGEIIS